MNNVPLDTRNTANTGTNPQQLLPLPNKRARTFSREGQFYERLCPHTLTLAAVEQLFFKI